MADPREFYNHDIGEMSSPDMVAAQEKLFAGGAMKTAIKRFLDEFDMFANEIAGLEQRDVRHYRKRVKELRKAMERWCNCG